MRQFQFFVNRSEIDLADYGDDVTLIGGNKYILYYFLNTSRKIHREQTADFTPSSNSGEIVKLIGTGRDIDVTRLNCATLPFLAMFVFVQ